MWELDCEEGWEPNNWCFWTVVLKDTLESPLDCKEIQLVRPKEDQSWIFTGWTDVEAETPILWPPNAKSWLIWKDPDAGKDGRQEEKMTEDEMVGWHQAWRSAVQGVTKNWTWMSSWTELNDSKVFFPYLPQRGYLIWAMDYYKHIKVKCFDQSTV